LHSDGTFRGDEFQINEIGAGAQYRPAVTSFSGGYAVTWFDGNAGRIEARFLADNGTVLTGDVSVSGTLSSVDEPQIVTLEDGSILITFQAYSTPGGNRYDVIGQRFDTTGRKIDGHFIVNQNISSDQYQPALVALPYGGAISVWYDQGSEIALQVIGNDTFGNALPDVRIEGLETAVVLNEAQANSGLIRLDSDSAVALGDGFDMDGALLRISYSDTGQIGRDGLSDLSDYTIGFVGPGNGQGAVSVVGTAVLVNGAEIGPLNLDGIAGLALSSIPI